VAYCDGDDWWTDPCKLQMQADLMESDPGCGMCYTGADEYWQAEGTLKSDPDRHYTDFEQMLLGISVPNCTALARRELIAAYYAEICPEEHPEWLTDDAPMWIWFAACSRIRASEEVTAVHRMLPESVSQSRAYRARIAFCDSLCDISLWFDARYGAGRHLRALRRRRMRVALWVLSRDGTTAEYLSRWWRDVRRTPLLVFDAAGYGLLVKKWLRRQPKR